MLTNIEVLELIKQNQEKRGGTKGRRSDGPKGDFRNRDFVERQLAEHLTTSLAGTSAASIKKYLEAIIATGIHFEKQEILQLANMVPRSEVEIHVLFGDGRFTDEQTQQLIESSNIALSGAS